MIVVIEQGEIQSDGADQQSTPFDSQIEYCYIMIVIVEQGTTQRNSVDQSSTQLTLRSNTAIL